MKYLTRFLAPQVLVGLIGGLVLTLFFLWVVAAGSAAPQSPHNVPVAAVGPRPAVTQLAAGLQRGGAFHVISTPTEAQALNLVQHRNADAIINVDTRQIQTAQAASPLTAIALPKALAHSPVPFQTIDIKPLASGDPTGLGLMFISLASVLGGIPAGIAFALIVKPRRPTSLADAGSRVLLIAGFCALQGLLIAAVADGILGYGGTHMLTVWAWSTMLSAASMVSSVAFIAALGIAGALVSAIPILFFGVPSAPVPSPWNWQPVVYRVLGPFDPFGAATNGNINGIYFPQASQAQNLWVVLGLWIGVPVLLLLGLGWRSQRASSVAAASSGDSVKLSGAPSPGAAA
jgi:hypothetical protein